MHWFVLIVTAGLLFAPNAHGLKKIFDGTRKGWVASASIGPGFTRIDSQNKGLSGSITEGTAVQIYRFGYAPNNQLQIYLTSRHSSVASDVWRTYGDWADEAKSKALGYIAFFPFLPLIAMFSDQHIIVGLGVTGYVRPTTPSWFFEAGIGPSDVGDPYDSDHVSAFPQTVGDAVGLFGGVGYEFNRSGRAELQYMWSHAGKDYEDGRRSWTAQSLMLVVTISGN